MAVPPSASSGLHTGSLLLRTGSPYGSAGPASRPVVHLTWPSRSRLSEMIADIVPVDITGLAIVLLAVVPGYLAVTIWGRRKTWKGRSTDLSTVVESITYSAVIQVVALPLTLTMLYPYRETLDAHEVRVAFWLIIVVLVLPIIGGTGWAWLSSLADSDSGPLKG